MKRARGIPFSGLVLAGAFFCLCSGVLRSEVKSKEPSYVLGETKELLLMQHPFGSSTALSPAEPPRDNEIVVLEKYTVTDSPSTRELARTLTRKLEVFRELRFDPVRGGVAYQTEFHRLKIQLGAWDDGRGLKLVSMDF